jgi:hypothetical protein
MNSPTHEVAESQMDYQRLDTLRSNHPAWRLMAADHAAFVASFLHKTFIAPNKRTIAEAILASNLEDYLYDLRREIGPDKFKRDAGTYLDEWSSDRCGWLRKYYAADTDEPLYDLAPAAELALSWLAGLGPRSFIGTESRLITIFELLRQLVEGTETDPDARVRALLQQRKAIDGQIAKIREGRVDILDPASVRDRFLEVVTTARSLLSDFRAVEQNFRNLDRDVRERIAIWDGNKADLLDDIFKARDAISESDQGRSFVAFWDLLMSELRQEELTGLLKKALELEAVQKLKPDRRILRIHHDWIAAGEVTQRTVAQLSSELRRYLDDKVWLENRRIMEILRNIEETAIQIRTDAPGDRFAEIDGLQPVVRLVMDRPLFSPPNKPEIDDLVSVAEVDGISADALFNRVWVDKARLRAHVWRALQQKSQISIAELLDTHPLEKGLAELIGYLSIASDDDGAVIDDGNKQTIAWTDDRGVVRQATLPLVIFTRSGMENAAVAGDGS